MHPDIRNQVLRGSLRQSWQAIGAAGRVAAIFWVQNAVPRSPRLRESSDFTRRRSRSCLRSAKRARCRQFYFVQPGS